MSKTSLVNCPQAQYVNQAHLKCNSGINPGINLSPANKTAKDFIHFKLIILNFIETLLLNTT